MEFSSEVIAKYFHMPIAQAAKEFNVGLTVFKSRCRDVGIKRWPYRKLKSMKELINGLQAENGGAQHYGTMRDIATMLKEEQSQLEEDPNLKFAKSSKRLRQRYFKYKYQKMKSMSLVLSLPNPTIAKDVIPLQCLSSATNSDYDDMNDAYGSNRDAQK